VEKVISFKFLGENTTESEKGPPTQVKKRQHHIVNLRRLKKFGLAPKALKLLQMHN
jgi:hypothetical protein